MLAQSGESTPIIMGSSVSSLERILSAAVEQSHDADGIVWPRAIAPFDAVVTVTNIKQPDMV